MPTLWRLGAALVALAVALLLAGLIDRPTSRQALPPPPPLPAIPVAPVHSHSDCPHLQVAFGQGSSASEQLSVALTFTNRGASSCSIAGYPTATFIGPGRRDDAEPDLGQLHGPAPRARPTVHLRPGQTASALLLGYLVNPNGGAQDCPPYSNVLVRPPGSAVASILPITGMSSSSALCKLHVNPIYPGTTGTGD